MTWDTVPWFVGGGAQHSPEVARLLAYAATSGAEGIVTPGDLKVVPLDIPGAAIRVLPGAALILNRASGGAQQTYVGRNPTADTVGISSTGSSGGRSDLIVARIKDPFVAGQGFDVPANPAVGPYIDTFVVPNVGASATTVPAGVSGIALARIDIPANTGTITAGMIVPLRDLALPREARVVNSTDRAGRANLNIDSSAFVAWPDYAPQVKVPRWATDFRQIVTVTSVRQFNATTKGLLRAFLGSIGGSGTEVNLTAQNGTAHVFVISNGGSRSAVQGQTLASRTDASITEGGLFVTSGAQIVHDVHFYERAA